ncbi:MAG: RlmE family RNA methyltransferase [Promethearchaeota archaeon]
MKPENHRRDYYHKKAKLQGFRSRAAYKLLQIDEKFHIIKGKKNILDLGCAPGSWIQAIISKSNNPQKLKIVGIDIKRIKPLDYAIILKMDVFSNQIIDKLKELFPNGIDLILSDMSPNISGNKSYDNARSLALLERAFFIAKNFLNQNGDFIAKFFQSQDTIKFINSIKKYFKIVKIHKPKASTKGNREMFVVAKNFKKIR